mgnify:CR=1 FL=1
MRSSPRQFANTLEELSSASLADVPLTTGHSTTTETTTPRELWSFLPRQCRVRRSVNSTHWYVDPAINHFFLFCFLTSSSLNNVGIAIEKNDDNVCVSVGTLKRMEINRLKVSPKCLSTLPNPDIEEDGPLPFHFVGVVTEVGLDEERPGSMFCYFIASLRKSKSHFSKKKKRKNPSKKEKKSTPTRVSTWEACPEIAKVLQTWLTKHVGDCMLEHVWISC